MAGKVVGGGGRDPRDMVRTSFRPEANRFAWKLANKDYVCSIIEFTGRHKSQKIVDLGAAAGLSIARLLAAVVEFELFEGA